jgi:hypothetical protein
MSAEVVRVEGLGFSLGFSVCIYASGQIYMSAEINMCAYTDLQQ